MKKSVAAFADNRQGLTPALRPLVDTHAHVFTRHCRMIKERRYTPPRPAPLSSFLGELDANAIDYGVLVQPSFLGTDNSYMLDCVAQSGGRLRGVVVLAPDADDTLLSNLDRNGVCALRYNLIGDDPQKLTADHWRSLTRRVTALGWHIQIHIDGTELSGVLDTLMQDNARVVFDHFGRPAPAFGRKDPGFLRLLDDAASMPVWVKLSGPYRFVDRSKHATADPATISYARALAEAFLERLGPDRLLWGSDWPWTQFEDSFDYRDSVRWLSTWLAGDTFAFDKLNEASLSLFGFPAGQHTNPATAAE